MHRLALIILALAAMVGLSQAASIDVNPDGSASYTTIEDAVDNSDPGDTIFLEPGLYTGPGNRDIAIAHELTIRNSVSHCEQVIIDLDADEDDPHRAFNCTNVDFTLLYVTIRGGYATSGAAIYAEESNVVIWNCYFQDNTADMYGGAIVASETSTVDIDNSVFGGNLAVDLGGACYASTDSELDLDNCTMVASSSAGGSAIAVNDNSYCELDQVIIAFGTGGAACLASGGSQVDASRTVVYHNTGGDWTGALSGQLTLRDNGCMDPLLSDPMANPGNFRPSADSPCGNQYPGGLVGARTVDEDWPHPMYSVETGSRGMFRDLAMAVADAPENAVIVLEAGIHVGSGYRDILWEEKDLVIRGRTGNPEHCTIDPIASQTDPHQVLEINDLGTTSRIEDITFLGGYAATGAALLIDGPGLFTIDNCNFVDNLTEDGGAISARNTSLRLVGCDLDANQCLADGSNGSAINILDADLTLDCCNFEGNQAARNGAVHVETSSGITDLSQLVMEACHFTDNGAGFAGGAVSTRRADLSATECVFTGNDTSGNDGGAVFCWSGDTADMEECRFENNHSSASGGALALHQIAQVTVASTAFEGNRTTTGYGGAVKQNDGMAHFDWCSFEDNQSYYPGGAFKYGQTGTPGAVSFDNCKFVGNRALQHEAAVISHRSPSELTLRQCTIHGHDNDDDPEASLFLFTTSTPVTFQACLVTDNLCPNPIVGTDGTPNGVHFTCSDLHGNSWGDWAGFFASQLDDDGNMCADPLYCDAPAGDLHVADTSPCLPDNNECSTLIGVYGQGCTAQVGVEDDALPLAALSCRNYPNPFNPQTTIAFDLPVSGPVQLDVFDAVGRRVRVLLTDSNLIAGRHTVTWDGRDQAGRPLGSGVYLARLSAGRQIVVQRMVMLK